jgi:hypothetical protein
MYKHILLKDGSQYYFKNCPEPKIHRIKERRPRDVTSLFVTQDYQETTYKQKFN